jgi:hypothetical protein
VRLEIVLGEQRAQRGCGHVMFSLVVAPVPISRFIGWMLRYYRNSLQKACSFRLNAQPRRGRTKGGDTI